MTEFKASLYDLIGSRIKIRREELEIKQEDLASNVGMSRTSISNIEKGRHKASIQTLFEISKALDYEIHFLIPTNKEVKDSLIDNPYIDLEFKEIIKNEQITTESETEIKDIIRQL